MPADAQSPETNLSPEDAFAVLGNETRMAIMYALAEADEPVSFSELRDLTDVSDSGQFNYHLGKLEGHFVEVTEAGYQLRQPGRWVVGALLTGAVTQDTSMEATPVDFACLYCGAQIELSYRDGRVELYCTECDGTFGESAIESKAEQDHPHGYLGGMALPPAGVQGRTPLELIRAASAWGHLQLLAGAYGVCPLCSARMENRPVVCESHEAAGGLCPNCERRHAVQNDRHCSNCVYKMRGPFVTQLIGSLDLRLFIGEHGIDPIADGLDWGWVYEEEVLSVNPFEAIFTFTADGETISLTVNDEMEITEVTKGTVSETA